MIEWWYFMHIRCIWICFYLWIHWTLSNLSFSLSISKNNAAIYDDSHSCNYVELYRMMKSSFGRVDQDFKRLVQLGLTSGVLLDWIIRKLDPRLRKLPTNKYNLRWSFTEYLLLHPGYQHDKIHLWLFGNFTPSAGLVCCHCACLWPDKHFLHRIIVITAAFHLSSKC